MKRRSAWVSFLLLLAARASGQGSAVHIVPNTHGTIVGWLVDFDTERNYVLNNYLEHLDMAARSADYRFVWSEVPNLISLLELEPQREAELRQLMAAGRVELANALFLEADLFLPSGETLVQLGVQGLRWQERVFGVKPRYAWAIDITGAHRQLPQIIHRLGLEGIVFCRNNPAGRSAFWWRAPDGSRTLAVTAPHYMELRELFRASDPADAAALEATRRAVHERLAYSATPRLALFLAGASDYSLPPALGLRAGEFLELWKTLEPQWPARFSTLSDYTSALRAEMERGLALVEYSGDTAFCFNGFWSNLPQVKRAFRHLEQQMRAAELAATMASLRRRTAYPSRTLNEAWTLLLVNADRNAIWGAGAGAAFRSRQHWDIWDRFEGARQRLDRVLRQALESGRSGPVLFNPLNWTRRDPFEVRLPGGRGLAGAACVADPENPSQARCRMMLPAAQAVPVAWSGSAPAPPAPTDLPSEIRTRFYRVRLDASTGEIAALASASGKPLLSGGSARVQLEEPPQSIAKVAADFMAPRRQRRVLPGCGATPQVRCWQGPRTVIVSSEIQCADHSVKRRVWFYEDFPRIDVDIVLELRRSDVLVTAEFPFAGHAVRRTRGIPFGFSEGPADERWLEPLPYWMPAAAEHRQLGYSAAVMPALGWSSHALAGGGGVALVEDGLPMHELAADRLVLGLFNAVSTYRGLPNEDLRGIGRHEFRFGLIPLELGWREAEVPLRAREFQAPPMMEDSAGPLAQPIRTSPNLLLEAMRRDGRDVEVRLLEWRGEPAMAWVEFLPPHRAARRTNLVGGEPRPLGRHARYRFAVMPQEIVTLRFELDSAVEEPPLLCTWEPLVPEAKRAGLKMRIRDKGHPPRPF